MDFRREGRSPERRKSTVFYHKVTAILILFQLTTFLNSIGEDRETYQKGMQDGVYWAKFWNFGKAGGTDNPYTRGTITKTYFD